MNPGLGTTQFSVSGTCGAGVSGESILAPLSALLATAPSVDSVVSLVSASYDIQCTVKFQDHASVFAVIAEIEIEGKVVRLATHIVNVNVRVHVRVRVNVSVPHVRVRV